MFDLFCLTEMRLNLLEVLTTLSISFFGGSNVLINLNINKQYGTIISVYVDTILYK